MVGSLHGVGCKKTIPQGKGLQFYFLKSLCLLAEKHGNTVNEQIGGTSAIEIQDLVHTMLFHK